MEAKRDENRLPDFMDVRKVPAGEIHSSNVDTVNGKSQKPGVRD